MWFWFAFAWWLVVLSSFSCASWPSVCLLWENVYSDCLFFCLPIFKSVFFFLFWCCMSSFICFSHSVGYIFIFWSLPLLRKNFLVWCSPICSFLLLFPLSEETYPKNITNTDVKKCTFLCFFLEVLWFEVLYISF